MGGRGFNFLFEICFFFRNSVKFIFKFLCFSFMFLSSCFYVFFFPFMFVCSKGSEKGCDFHILVQFSINLVIDGWKGPLLDEWLQGPKKSTPKREKRVWAFSCERHKLSNHYVMFMFLHYRPNKQNIILLIDMSINLSKSSNCENPKKAIRPS